MNQPYYSLCQSCGTSGVTGSVCPRCGTVIGVSNQPGQSSQNQAQVPRYGQIQPSTQNPPRGFFGKFSAWLFWPIYARQHQQANLNYPPGTKIDMITVVSFSERSIRQIYWAVVGALATVLGTLAVLNWIYAEVRMSATERQLQQMQRDAARGAFPFDSMGSP